MRTASCPTCGRPLDQHDRHVRLVLPDPVLEVPERERPERTWGGDRLLQVHGVGSFVRVLLPIRLSRGYSLTLGTWLSVHPDRLRDAWEHWETDAYPNLTFDGYLANAIPPWGPELLAAPATAAVRDASELPYIEASKHPLLHQVLTSEWAHEDVLAAYESVL